MVQTPLWCLTWPKFLIITSSLDVTFFTVSLAFPMWWRRIMVLYLLCACSCCGIFVLLARCEIRSWCLSSFALCDVHMSSVEPVQLVSHSCRFLGHGSICPMRHESVIRAIFPWSRWGTYKCLVVPLFYFSFHSFSDNSWRPSYVSINLNRRHHLKVLTLLVVPILQSRVCSGISVSTLSLPTTFGIMTQTSSYSLDNVHIKVP